MAAQHIPIDLRRAFCEPTKQLVQTRRSTSCGKNYFILFDFRCAGMRHLLHISDFPTVADHSVERFPGYSFSIDLCWTEGVPSISPPHNDIPGDTAMAAHGDRNEEEITTLTEPQEYERDGTILRHERDLPRFWQMLRFLFQQLQPPGLSNGGSGADRTAPKASASHVPRQAVFAGLSLRVLPFQPFHSRPDALSTSRPQGFADWQDSGHLASLTSRDKSILWWSRHSALAGSNRSSR